MSHGSDAVLLEYFFNHEDEAKSFLKPQFNQSDNLKSLLAAFVQEVQEADTAVVDLVRSRLLGHASGDALDQYGKVVGVKRGSLEEAEYRTFIRAKIKANISEGTIDEVIDIFRRITGDDDVVYWEHYPAGFHLDVERSSRLSDELRSKIVDIMDQAIPAGVSRTYSESTSESFRFDDADRGFGSPFSTTDIEQ